MPTAAAAVATGAAREGALAGNRYDVVPGDDVPPPAPTSQPPPMRFSGVHIERYDEPPLEAAQVTTTVPQGDPLSPPTHPLGSTGITAVAIYDYQKQDDDEISFDPDDIITNIDKNVFGV
ncbi:unnamed protein product [Gongylonema pulchrum]|uniref:SH3 domain-containing protein n=1 Tax=Gongylonema pulchrum TaxID=637853 RepID=A0A183DIR5_9BILA|nr:unnamed protein product [Gongylonema pulchrum]